MNAPLYAISGMGVDERLFRELRLEREVRHVKWIAPRRKEPLASYALRLAEQIDTSRPFSLMGVSFGGMCAVEIAKVHAPEKLVLISTCKTKDELPFWIRGARFLPVHRLCSERFIARFAMLNRWIFGIRRGEEAALFTDMLRRNPPRYLRETISAVMSWNNTEAPQGCLHLHGKSDRLLPLRFIRRSETIAGGTHVMVIHEAEEISRKINAFF